MREDVVDKIRAAGVVGAGGAGFPTHVKVQFSVDHVLGNGASCEPLLKSDPYLMEHLSASVLDGLHTVMECTGAGNGKICIKSKHESALETIKHEIVQSDGNGVGVFELDDYYPAGDEFVLVHEVIGKTVPEGGIPLNVKTVVCNVESLLNVSRAMAGKPVTDRYLTVGGAVRKPIVCKLPIGTSVAKAIELAGGSAISDYGIVMGGPMMGHVLAGDWEPITKTTSGILVLPALHNVIKDKQKDIGRMRFIAKSACTQCSRCTDLCPRNLIGHGLEPHKIMRHLAYAPDDTGAVLEDALICSECGICEKFACPMMLSPREINSVLKKKLLKEGVKREPKRTSYSTSPFFDTRKIPVKRLMERLDVTRYDVSPDIEVQGIDIATVSILLKQHLGEAAIAVVSTGSRVKRGDVIGEIPQGALGARVHASIDGTIQSIDETRIIINRSEHA